jgi:small subunit ribosomal protein S15
MLTQEEKDKLIKKYKVHDKDTGSVEVQIALLTEQINQLLDHLKDHPKDLHSKRGLLTMVSKRKKLLKNFEAEDEKKYKALIKNLGLKK